MEGRIIGGFDELCGKRFIISYRHPDEVDQPLRKCCISKVKNALLENFDCESQSFYLSTEETGFMILHKSLIVFMKEIRQKDKNMNCVGCVRAINDRQCETCHVRPRTSVKQMNCRGCDAGHFNNHPCDDCYINPDKVKQRMIERLSR